jgi:hypothetical protein
MKIMVIIAHSGSIPFEMNVGCADPVDVEINVRTVIESLGCDDWDWKIVSLVYTDVKNDVVVLMPERARLEDAERLVVSLTEGLSSFYKLEETLQ